MSWFVLTEGMPAEPSGDDKVFPYPSKFLSALCFEMSGVSCDKMQVILRAEDHYDRGEVARFGTEEVGFLAASIESRESSCVDTLVEFATYGLKDIEVRWWHSLSHMGQAGRAGYKHRRLEARFEAGAEARFASLYQRHFGQTPRFSAIASPEEPRFLRMIEEMRPRR